MDILFFSTYSNCRILYILAKYCYLYLYCYLYSQEEYSLRHKGIIVSMHGRRATPSKDDKEKIQSILNS